MQIFFVLIGQSIVGDFTRWVTSQSTLAAIFIFAISATAWITGKFVAHQQKVGRARRAGNLALRRNRSMEVEIRTIMHTMAVHSTRLDRIDARLDQIDRRLDKLDSTLDRINARMEEGFHKLSTTVTQLVIANNHLNIAMTNVAPGFIPILIAQSPLRLSDVGIAILEASGGRAYLDQHVDGLIALLESKQLLTGLDVQNEAYLAINELSSNRDFADIRTYVYENPMYHLDDREKTPVSMTTVVQVMAIYLRDIYLESHPFVIRKPAA
jgi:hypothetical protein